MPKKKRKSVKKVKLGCNTMKCASGCGIYGVGFIGALVYYIQTTTGIWGTIIGVLKAIVWPAFLVWKLLGGDLIPKAVGAAAGMPF